MNLPTAQISKLIWRRGRRGFTLVELLVVIACTAFMASMLLPAMAKTKPDVSAAYCLKNLKQLTAAGMMYARDYNDKLVSAQNLSGRTNWFEGLENWTQSASNWDTNQDMINSPLWGYLNRNPAVFKCPSDKSFVIVSGTARARLRSYSMSQVFGTGEWLPPTDWRTYAKVAEIFIPAKTWIFADEHPNSIDDGSLAVECTGADFGAAARIIDFPASYHFNGACGFSFADGRAETHRWLGTTIKRSITYGSTSGFPLNVSAGDSGVDIKWLAANTTVRR
jgi:prepilin-type N-terminal cleavage/methylation domain-containing protein